MTEGEEETTRDPEPESIQCEPDSTGVLADTPAQEDLHGAETSGESRLEPPADPQPVDPAIDGGTMLFCTTAALLAWLVPGAGHAYVGEWRRAVVFAVLLSGLFIGGIALDGKIYRIEEDDVLSYAASLGASGLGGPYILGHALGFGDGDDRADYHEYGSTFTLVAGLLNLLVILDAFDHAMLRRKAALEARPVGLDR